MTMMSPQEQLTSPFFLGGDHILVSYPTDTMEFEARMESMRGNNPGFAHATAFHEMIPGHNLVGYLNQRYRDYRPSLTSGGPFYGEGWPLYWELTMYELGFDKTPEQKVGALFKCMHCCARIIFLAQLPYGDTGRPSRPSTSSSTRWDTSATTRWPKCAARSNRRSNT